MLKAVLIALTFGLLTLTACESDPLTTAAAKPMDIAPASPPQTFTPPAVKPGQ